jgi:putative ABC transport system permease protein
MLLPMQLHEKLNHGFNWLWFSLNTFVLLQPQADTKKVESSIAKVYKAEAGDYVEKMKKEHGFNSTIEYKLQPLLNIHLSTTYSARSGLADASDPVYSYILSVSHSLFW